MPDGFRWFWPTHHSRIALLVYLFQTICWQDRHIQELREEIARYVADASQRRRTDDDDSEQRRGD